MPIAFLLFYYYNGKHDGCFDTVIAAGIDKAAACGEGVDYVV